MRAAILLVLALAALSGCERETDVRILEHRGRWESGYGAEFYNVVGRLRNQSGRPVAWVKLRVEALDASGKVVASTETYNESAESLTVEVEGLPADAAARLKAAAVKPLADGSEERFRASFLKEETPEFTDYRVVVVEAPAGGTP